MQMNAIERMRDHLFSLYPSAKMGLIAPLREKGMWSLDIDSGPIRLSIQWNARSGFGISNVHNENLGEGADEIYSSFEEAIHRVDRLMKGEEQSAPPLAVLLARLRERRGLTQQDVASKLGVKQATISGMERRDDIQLSTLRKLISALGGCLEVFARFPEGNYRLALAASPAGKPKSEVIPCDPKRRPADSRQRFSSTTFRQLSKVGRLQGAVETAQRIRNCQSVLEMYC
jgi:transcriptional regulator with XRE-family HTH domain